MNLLIACERETPWARRISRRTSEYNLQNELIISEHGMNYLLTHDQMCEICKRIHGEK